MGAGAEGRREKESQANYVLSVKPDMGLDPTTLKPELKSAVGHPTD